MATLRGPVDPATLRQSARDYVWLLDARRGRLVREIARHEGVTVAEVLEAIARARALDGAPPPGPVDPPPRLRPIMPLILTPASECPHRGAIPDGSDDYCVVCDRSGHDAELHPDGPPED